MKTSNFKVALAERLKVEFQVEHEIKGNFLFVRVQKSNYMDIARHLKEQGLKRLLTVSAIDWIEEEEFEVYFIANNPDENVYVKCSTRIPRSDPKIQSLSSIWENSSMHERETWELFGIIFNGNDMLKPLLLEKWEGLPPFRKDFDWREYAKNN